MISIVLVKVSIKDYLYICICINSCINTSYMINEYNIGVYFTLTDNWINLGVKLTVRPNDAEI